MLTNLAPAGTTSGVAADSVGVRRSMTKETIKAREQYQELMILLGFVGQ